MSDSIEWTHAENGFTLIGPDEDAGDGNTPDTEEVDPGNYGLRMGNCCLYGQPEELLELLSGMKQRIISQCIDDGRVAPAGDDTPEPRFHDSEVSPEVPF